MNQQAVEDWLRVRRTLLDMEAAFTRLAIQVIDGRASEADLEEQRQVLEATRELCSVAYQRAFPKKANQS